MKLLTMFALPILLASSPASAATRPDLDLSLSAPPGVHVDQNGRYTITVANTGNRNASGVVLTIQLPQTHTSPTVHILGVLGARDGRCVLAGTKLTCGLNTIARFGGSTAVYVDLALPYSSAPIVIGATATTTTAGDPTPGNNSLAFTATPATYATMVTGPMAADSQHCTGTGLTSYFECELYPSSISGFDSVLEANGTVSVSIDPTVTGSWSFSAPDRLVISYQDSSGPIGTLDARHVGGDCFEGPMTFPTGPWVAIYQVCLVN